MRIFQFYFFPHNYGNYANVFFYTVIRMMGKNGGGGMHVAAADGMAWEL